MSILKDSKIISLSHVRGKGFTLTAEGGAKVFVSTEVVEFMWQLQDNVKDHVIEALDNARANGLYLDLSAIDYAEVAKDLMKNSKPLENRDFDDVMFFVEQYFS